MAACSAKPATAWSCLRPAASKSESTSISQTAPANIKESRIKLALPTGTDVRLNDKIVDRKNGCEYIAEIPHDIHGHHLFVYVVAKGTQRYL